MAGYCTRGEYFHSPSARKNTSAHLYNILPYSTFTGAIIIIIINYHCVDIFFQYICDRCTYVRTCACMASVSLTYRITNCNVSWFQLCIFININYNIQLLVVMQENGVVHLVTLSHLHDCQRDNDTLSCPRGQSTFFSNFLFVYCLQKTCHT